MWHENEQARFWASEELADEPITVFQLGVLQQREIENLQDGGPPRPV